MLLMLGIELPDDFDEAKLKELLHNNVDGHKNCKIAHTIDSDGEAHIVHIAAPKSHPDYAVVGETLQNIRNIMHEVDDKYDEWTTPSVRMAPYFGGELPEESECPEVYPLFHYPYDRGYSQHEHVTIDITLPDGCTSGDFLRYVSNRFPNYFESENLLKFYYSETWFEREENALVDIDMHNMNDEQLESQMSTLACIANIVSMYVDEWIEETYDDTDDDN